MKDAVLVKKYTSNIDMELDRRVNIVIDDMHKKIVCDEIVQTIEDLGFVDLSQLVLKYTGIELIIPFKKMPSLLKAFLDRGIKVLSIYEEYK